MNNISTKELNIFRAIFDFVFKNEFIFQYEIKNIYGDIVSITHVQMDANGKLTANNDFKFIKKI